MAGRHRRDSPGACAQWLRVGALTVGLGAAVTAGQGIATAAPADTTDSAQSTNTDSSATTETTATGATTAASGTSGSSSASSASTSSSTGPTSTVSAQQNTGDSTTAATETAKKSEQSTEASSESVVTAKGSDSTGTRATTADVETTNKSGSAHDATTADSETRTPASHEAAAVTAQTLSVRSAATPTVNVATPTTVSMAVQTTTAVQTTVKTIAAQPPAAAPVTVASMVTDVLTWIGLGPLANGLPVPAAPVSSLVEGLWLAVREAEYRLNNQRPVAQPTVSGQGPDGTVTGRVNATDYDDGTITLTVSSAPEHGTVVVDESGIFTYTPDPEWAATGGTDSFTITVDDTVGNPLHVHGLLGLIGQAGPTSATVTVSVSPTTTTAGRTSTDTTVRTTADAAQFLNGLAPMLGAATGFASPDNITVQHVGTTPGDVAETFYRVHETIDGITVLGSDVILVTDARGTVTGLFNNHDDRIADTDITPDARLDNPAEAVAVAATAYLASTTGQTDRTSVAAFVASSTFDPELVVYALDSGAPPRLAWRVVVQPSDIPQQLGLTAPDPGATYFVYANGADAGTVIVDTPNVQALSTTTTARDVLGQTRQINVVDTTVWFFFHTSALSDTTRNIATYWTSYQFFGWGAPVLPGSIVNPGWFGWDAAPVSAHANEAAVYDYYKDVLGLTSFNGLGAAINVSVAYNPHATWSDYFSGYNNAFWDPSRQQFVFGNGGDLEAALDVVGHEFTHAVVSYAVGDGGSVLDYGESGALNEAFADIMGSLIEGKSGTGRWLIGEDSHFAGGAVRNLANPSAITTAYGPYRQTYATRYTGTGDDGGEHINSTIFSHAAYEMMTDAATASISQQTWAKVFYHALYRLSPGATFADGRAAVLDSADALGFTAAQLDAIDRAFDDVGIPVGVTVLI